MNHQHWLKRHWRAVSAVVAAAALGGLLQARGDGSVRLRGKFELTAGMQVRETLSASLEVSEKGEPAVSLFQQEMTSELSPAENGSWRYIRTKDRVRMAGSDADAGPLEGVPLLLAGTDGRSAPTFAAGTPADIQAEALAKALTPFFTEEFLPENPVKVGQSWPLDPAGLETLVRKLEFVTEANKLTPSGTMELTAVEQGPDGRTGRLKFQADVSISDDGNSGSLHFTGNIVRSLDHFLDLSFECTVRIVSKDGEMASSQLRIKRDLGPAAADADAWELAVGTSRPKAGQVANTSAPEADAKPVADPTPPVQLGTPVLDKFEQLEAAASDPGDIAAYRAKAGEIEARIREAKEKGDLPGMTDLVNDLHALGLYHGRSWPGLEGYWEYLRIQLNDASQKGTKWQASLKSQAARQYYKALSFSLAGWGLASDEASSLVYGYYGGSYHPKSPMQDKTYEAQGWSLLARNGLNLTKNRGGEMALASIVGRQKLTTSEFARKSLELQPNSPRVRATWSMVLAERGELAEAIRQADAAVALCPKSSTYLANRAYVKCLAGYPITEIGKDWESALAVRKNNPLVYYDRAMYRLANESAEKAVEDFDRAINPNVPCPSDAYLQPAVAWSLNARGEILKAAGETEKALEDFKLAAATGPRGPWTQAVSYKAGLLLANSGRVEESVAFFRGAQDMYYQNPDDGHRARIAAALASAEKGIWPPRVETRKFTDEEIMLGTAAGALLLFFVADAYDQVRTESAMRGELSSSDLAALAAIDDDAERERERLRLSQKASQDFQQWQGQQQSLKQSNWHKTTITPLKSSGTFRSR